LAFDGETPVFFLRTLVWAPFCAIYFSSLSPRWLLFGKQQHLDQRAGVRDLLVLELIRRRDIARRWSPAVATGHRVVPPVVYTAHCAVLSQRRWVPLRCWPSIGRKCRSAPTGDGGQLSDAGWLPVVPSGPGSQWPGATHGLQPKGMRIAGSGVGCHAPCICAAAYSWRRRPRNQRRFSGYRSPRTSDRVPVTLRTPSCGAADVAARNAGARGSPPRCNYVSGAAPHTGGPRSSVGHPQVLWLRLCHRAIAAARGRRALEPIARISPPMATARAASWAGMWPKRYDGWPRSSPRLLSLRWWWAANREWLCVPIWRSARPR